MPADLGAAYGTAKAGVGLASMGVMNPSLVMSNVLPVIMAGVLGIYGLIVGAIINGRSEPPARSPACRALRHLCLQVCWGLSMRQRQRMRLAAQRRLRPGKLSVPATHLNPPRLVCAPRIRPAVLPPSGGQPAYSLFEGYAHLASGLACGLSALAAGLAIGIAGDAGVRAVGQIRDETNRRQMSTGVILVLVFGEALSLYGLIVSLVLSQKSAPDACV